MAKIFWVEDQSHWIEKFRDILLQSDLDGGENEIEIHKYSESARQQIALTPQDKGPDIALLDANMNGNDQAGFQVSTALLKKWPDLPIIFFSEHSGTDIEKDALAVHQVTDFIAKHQKNIEEVLCWRLRAALRQKAVRGQGGASIDSNVLSSGDLRMDLDSWEVYWRGVKLMNPDNPRRPLAPTPRKILRCLVERSPRPVTTEQIAEFMDVDPDGYSSATYRQHIKTLRRAFDAVFDGSVSFVDLCKDGQGIVNCSEQGSYAWVKIS